MNASEVCSTCISFVLSLCVQSFHTLNKLEPYVSLLLFYCFGLSFVGGNPEVVVDVGPGFVSIPPPSNIR